MIGPAISDLAMPFRVFAVHKANAYPVLKIVTSWSDRSSIIQRQDEFGSLLLSGLTSKASLEIIRIAAWGSDSGALDIGQQISRCDNFL